MEEIKNLVFTNLVGPADFPGSNYKQQFQTGAIVTVEIPALESFDKTTKKVECSGKITFKWPTALVERVKQTSPGGSWGEDVAQGTYSVQPSADGKGLIYAIDGNIANNAGGSLLAMMSALGQADATAQAQAAAAKAPPPPSPTDAPETGSAGSSGNQNSDPTAADRPPQ